VRPVEELKDFSRVTLGPGETRTLSFSITPDKLEAFDLAMRRTVQPGDFEVLVGASSVDTLKGALRVD
jgi:beta-glucosidase